jgi:hypothetical protein
MAIDGYWWLYYRKLLVAIGGYFINDYWWLLLIKLS